MNELPPKAREFLTIARRAHRRVPDGAKERVRGALHGAAIAAGRADGASASSPVAASGTSGSLGKLLAASGAATALVGVTAALLSMRAPTAAPERAAQPAAQAEPAEDGAEPASPAVTRGAGDEPVGAEAVRGMGDESVRAVARDDARTLEAGERPLRAQEDAALAALGAEIALIERAERALRAGDAKSAQAALRAYGARFEKGQLRTERVGLEIIVGCTLETHGARERARRYLAAASDAALRLRIAEACAVATGEEQAP